MINIYKDKYAYGWELKIFGLTIIYWGKKYKDTYFSIDTKKTRYVFGLRRFKYYGKSNVSNLV